MGTHGHIVTVHLEKIKDARRHASRIARRSFVTQGLSAKAAWRLQFCGSEWQNTYCGMQRRNGKPRDGDRFRRTRRRWAPIQCLVWYGRTSTGSPTYLVGAHKRLIRPSLSLSPPPCGRLLPTKSLHLTWTSSRSRFPTTCEWSPSWLQHVAGTTRRSLMMSWSVWKKRSDCVKERAKQHYYISCESDMNHVRI